jgi:YegS/Rv2252/BmrU family lipid kinase
MNRIFIVNPKAGKGKALKAAKIIESICEQENLEYIIHYTKEKEDATCIARQYRENENIVYSVGGDGTLNEVVNGIALSNTILGIIPAGTGNDFVRSLTPKRELVTKIDIGKVNHKYFINIASLGLDAKIAKNADIMKAKKIPNSLVYLSSIGYTIFNYENTKVKINNSKHDDMVTLMAFCNGCYYGGGIKLAPNASIEDGFMDVYMVDDLSKYKILYLLTKLLTSSHERHPSVHKYRTDKITVDSSENLLFNVDGEIMIDNHFDIEIINNGINLISNDHPKIMKLLKNRI